MSEQTMNKSQTLSELVGPEELPWALYDLIRTMIRIYEAHQDEIEQIGQR